MARSKAEFGAISCPGGATGLSPGFQPWESSHQANRPERARDDCMVEACSYRVRTGALSGRGAVWAGFPGLKPRAESYSPFFGAPNLPDIPLLRDTQPRAKQIG